MRKWLWIVMGIGALGYLGLYFYFFSTQTAKFKSAELAADYSFQFKEKFEELDFKSKDGGRINALFFKSDSSKGVVCFWKGNGANLATWGSMAGQYLKYNHDIIIADYREHGKSTGAITIDNFYADSQLVYDFLKTRYREDQIVIVGYSLGTSIASHLSATNKPRETILIEPRERFYDKYLSILFFPLPDINRFPFRTDRDLQASTSPVAIIAGTKSSLYRDALKLKSLQKEGDSYFEIQGADHGSILRSPELDRVLGVLLRD